VNLERGALAQSVQARLVQHAKGIGVDPNVVLTRYAVERFLYRLSRSRHAERFVLKGALLLIAWLGETLRPTRDADLLGYGELSEDDIKSVFREVCALEVEPDAITFFPETLDVQQIREEDAYGGRRVTLQARLGPARLKLQFDIGIGDAVAPEWLEYPSLLDLPRARLRAYPREAVVAEKLHAMVMLGMRNSRFKDYFDVHALLREGAMEEARLAHAISATFARRRTQLPDELPAGLSVAFAEDASRQARWRAFLDKNRLQGPDLPELVREVREGLRNPLDTARGNLRP
jgi:predicted nucleotidyltransferase component of viral defense system